MLLFFDSICFLFWHAPQFQSRIFSWPETLGFGNTANNDDDNDDDDNDDDNNDVDDDGDGAR